MPFVQPARHRLVPDPTPVADAISASAMLASLQARLRASQACLAAIVPLLPGGLAGQLRAGPLDDAGWSVLAANAAVAAKLRHLVPRFETALADAGLAVASIRVKVLA